MPAIRLATLVLPFVLCLCAELRADTVILKSGDKVEGKILGETDAEVTICVQVTATIKDERVLKRADIEKVLKVKPDDEAWATIGTYEPGSESLEHDDYERAKAALQYFITSFPNSAYAPLAKQRLEKFAAEQKRADAGEVKLDDRWLSKERVKEERVQVAGHILLNRMKRAAAAGQITEAMAIFDQLEKGFLGSASYPHAVELARRLLPPLKTAVEQRHVQFKRHIEDEKQRLATSKGTEHDQLDALIKKETATTEATIAAFERAGVKWLPLQPVNERSLTALTSRITAEMPRLNGLHTEKMHESVKTAEEAASALAAGKFDFAEKTLREATSAWQENELAKRLLVKLADAKKGALAPKAATPTPTPKPKPNSSASTSSSSAPVPSAPGGEEQPAEKPFFQRAYFFVGIAVVIAFGAIGGKMLAKSRTTAANALDN